MKNLKRIVTLLLLLCVIVASAEEVTINGITYNIITKGKTAEVIASSNDYTGDIIIPESVEYNGTTYNVTNIRENAFRYCHTLTSIIIPNSITSIGDYAFDYCSGLTNLTIPNSVTYIGTGAFQWCKGLTNLTIPNSITNIGRQTFRYCTGLESLTISNGVESIDYEAFYYCYNLTSLTIGNSVVKIEGGAFEDCSNLINLTIPNNVAYIGGSAFKNCSSLTSITIPNSVTSIGNSTFSGCSSLTTVTIGNGINYISSCAFEKCGKLLDVYCLATTVPSTDTDAFKDSYPEYITLHVPKDAINSYKTSQSWTNFGTIVAFDGGDVKKCATPSIAYSNGNLYFNCDTEEAEFVTDITSNDFGKFYNNSIELSATYNISLYATAQGYENSETVNATLCWIDNNYGNNSNNIINVQATPILITSTNGIVTINCSLNGKAVAVYTTGGVFVGTTTIENDSATIATGLSKGTIAVVNIGEESVKVII